jgi:triphosphoribosyl-dephospho-CoA synthase
VTIVTAPARTPLRPDVVGRLAAQSLRAEATLTPKPGLVDRRGGGAHHDMTMALLLTSADALEAPVAACAAAATALPLGPELRAEIGAIGRAGERAMLDATGGVNTHRGALWALGLLAAGVAAAGGDLHGAARFAARLARLDDPAAPRRALSHPSHGEQARRRYGAAGAAGEARAGFPHTTTVALPALRRARATVADEEGADEDSARLDALMSAMATLEDTCLLHRGGPTGLRLVRTGAAAVLAAGGSGTRLGRRRLDTLDRLCRERRLSAGGSGDVLAATLFVDALDLGALDVGALDHAGPGEEHPSCAR